MVKIIMYCQSNFKHYPQYMKGQVRVLHAVRRSECAGCDFRVMSYTLWEQILPWYRKNIRSSKGEERVGDRPGRARGRRGLFRERRK